MGVKRDSDVNIRLHSKWVQYQFCKGISVVTGGHMTSYWPIRFENEQQAYNKYLYHIHFDVIFLLKYENAVS